MKNIAPNIIEEMSGNSICQESPGKHPGNIRERSIYQGFELKKRVARYIVEIWNEWDRQIIPQDYKVYLIQI